jgi:hypothetical protein
MRIAARTSHHDVLAISAAILASLAPPALRAQNDYRPLFDGTLAGWHIENTEHDNIFLENGTLVVAEPAGWLRSSVRYADFTLRVEFRFLTDDADSGIFVRAAADTTFGPGWPGNSYQVQLRNPDGDSPFPPVGGIFRHGMPNGATEFDASDAERLSLGTGVWQTLEIAVHGDALTVALNGASLTRAGGIANARGYIGFQAETGRVEFRAIDIMEQ